MIYKINNYLKMGCKNSKASVVGYEELDCCDPLKPPPPPPPPSYGYSNDDDECYSNDDDDDYTKHSLDIFQALGRKFDGVLDVLNNPGRTNEMMINIVFFAISKGVEPPASVVQMPFEEFGTLSISDKYEHNIRSKTLIATWIGDNSV